VATLAGLNLSADVPAKVLGMDSSASMYAIAGLRLGRAVPQRSLALVEEGQEGARNTQSTCFLTK